MIDLLLLGLLGMLPVVVVFVYFYFRIKKGEGV